MAPCTSSSWLSIPVSAGPSTSWRSWAASRTWPQSVQVQRVVAPVCTVHWSAYQTLLERGYRIDFTMVRMKRGKQIPEEDPADLVLDDWR